MSVVLSDVAAVQSDQADIIGHLTWYSISEILIRPSELRQKMIDSGVGEGWMPKPIRVSDAFRRATAIKNRRPIAAGVHENYLCREVASDQTMVQRNIVCETVDTKGKRLDYQQDAAVLVLDKKSAQISITSSTPSAHQMAQEAAHRFDIFREHYSGSVLRTTLMNILKGMSPTPVRPSGGVYFIPRQFEDQLKSFREFVRSLEKGESEMVPLINTKDMTGMITRMLHEHLQRIIQNCNEGLTLNLPKGHVKEILDEARRVVADYKEYNSIVTGDLKEMEMSVQEIRSLVTAMLEKMAG